MNNAYEQAQDNPYNLTYVNCNANHTNQQYINELLMFELLGFQKLLNLQLMKNQIYVDCFIPYIQSTKDGKNGKSYTGSTSDGVQNQKAKINEYQGINKLKIEEPIQDEIDKLQNNNVGQKQKQRKSELNKMKYNNQDSEYNPEGPVKQKVRVNINSQSKNVPKNISKAILIFIKNKQSQIRQFLEQMNLNTQQFMSLVVQLKGKINAIAQLRSLWIDQSNKYAKVFRVISNYYLRKHSLHHIFNSRVMQYSKHLKYRHTVMKALKNPQIFTHMKEY